jgi:FlaA1/EpsC-like NDP-sugar epimerase
MLSKKYWRESMETSIYKDANILVTGGAGSIGARLVEKLLEKNPKAIRVLDNSEYNLFKLRELVKRDGRVRYLLGDVRNPERVKMAVRGADIVFHLAAIKHIDFAYYNIEEALETNITGTKNMINACMEEPSVKRVMFVSSDKAANAIGLYGMTKLIGEKVTQWAAEIQSQKIFCTVRFGNVIESSGNVFEIWKMQAARGLPVTITSKEMMRYFWSVRECVGFIARSCEAAKNGEVYIPKMKKFNIYEMAIKKGYSVKVCKVRRDEKYDEDLMTVEEQKHAADMGAFWILKKIPPEIEPEKKD